MGNHDYGGSDYICSSGVLVLVALLLALELLLVLHGHMHVVLNTTTSIMQNLVDCYAIHDDSAVRTRLQPLRCLLTTIPGPSHP
ncbi:hypothetical protein GQ600_1868 [Phytophthora cactorum]|nr:hypothetical protein GQ600_1868 [Phytophthora cactorum]